MSTKIQKRVREPLNTLHFFRFLQLTMSYWDEEPLPSVQEVRKWNRGQVIENLQKIVNLEEDEIQILRKKRISGKSFLGLTEEKLEQFGLEFGPASEIAEFVKAINGDETASDYVRLSELENEIASLRAQLNNNAYGGCADCCGV